MPANKLNLCNLIAWEKDYGGNQSTAPLKSDLYFTGKKDMVLRNYRASDGLALAAFYKIPILVRKNLLKEKMEV